MRKTMQLLALTRQGFLRTSSLGRQPYFENKGQLRQLRKYRQPRIKEIRLFCSRGPLTH